MAPSNSRDILHFLFASQNRYRSELASRAALFDLPSPELFPTEAASPPTPFLSPGASSNEEENHVANISVSPPSPSPAPARQIRVPFGEKKVNQQLVLTKSTSSPRKEDVLSPFTALPPKLGLKLRGIRAKLSPKKTVDVGFLGPTATRRRKDQFNAAMRKLEGTGDPEEQRSDEESDETDNSGVLEGSGEGTTFLSFAR